VLRCDTCCAGMVLQEGEPLGRHVVIVDDLVQSGGTLIECHALLSSLGATHGTEQLRGHARWGPCKACRPGPSSCAAGAGHYIPMAALRSASLV